MHELVAPLHDGPLAPVKVEVRSVALKVQRHLVLRDLDDARLDGLGAQLLGRRFFHWRRGSCCFFCRLGRRKGVYVFLVEEDGLWLLAKRSAEALLQRLVALLFHIREDLHSIAQLYARPRERTRSRTLQDGHSASVLALGAIVPGEAIDGEACAHEFPRGLFSPFLQLALLHLEFELEQHRLCLLVLLDVVLERLRPLAGAQEGGRGADAPHVVLQRLRDAPVQRLAVARGSRHAPVPSTGPSLSFGARGVRRLRCFGGGQRKLGV